MLSLSFLNPTTTALNTITNFNINNKEIEKTSIVSGRITRTDMYIPTDSFKYYLDYASVEKVNFSLQQEIIRIEEEERRAEEERQRQEAERQAEIERQNQLQIEKEQRAAAIRRENLRRQQLEAAARQAQANSLSTPVGSVADRIVYWSNHYGIDSNRAIRIAQCESGLNPGARSPNGLYGGVYQQAFTYWPARAAAVGLSGASVFDAEANIRVSMHMMATQGFHHWPVCSTR